jgi:hypothetical protein
MSNHDKVKILCAILLFLAGFGSLYGVFRALKSGKVRVGRLGSITYKKENPQAYWFFIYYQAGMGIVLLILSPLWVYYILKHTTGAH